MQIFTDIFTLALALFAVARGAGLIIKYMPPLALLFGLSGFLTSFLIVGVISVFPELSISIISAIKGVPALGLGTIFGSNVADLTLVLGIAALFAGKGLRVRSNFLKDDLILIAPLLLPIALGIDGEFSRMDGATLITAGLIVFFFLYQRNKKEHFKDVGHLRGMELLKAFSFFVFGLGALIGGAYTTVIFAERISNFLLLPEVLMGISFVTFGTLIPELIFSIKAARAKEGELVLGDILGIVITDITLVLGVMSFLSPFSFDSKLISFAGFAMVFAALVSLSFMKSGRILSKNEGVILVFLYIIFLSMAFSLEGGLL